MKRALLIWRIGSLGFALLFSAPAAAEVNQATAQGNAANVNHRGSDDDLDEATTNGMQALMNLASLNIPGAFSKGYEAYGNYINSQKLDELEAKTKNLKNSMTSVTAGAVGANDKNKGVAGVDSRSEVTGTTTFSRLSPDFLYQGKAAAVAEEFEKRTGMKREEFLMHLGSATDAKLNFDDPDLMNKLEQRYQAFKARVTNKDFRDGLEKVEGLFPQALRQKALSEIQSLYVGARNGKDDARLASSSAGAASTAPIVVADRTEMPAAPAVGEAPKIESNRAPASEKATPTGEKLGMFIGLQGNSDALKDFFASSAAAGNEDSIFKIVSLRYRKLTPALVGMAKAAR